MPNELPAETLRLMRQELDRILSRNEPQKVTKMPFGKYKGEYLSQIPERYLRWVMDNMDLSPALYNAIFERVD